MSAVRRGRRPSIDVTRTWDIAEWLEDNLGPGFHLFHTHRMDWLLRQLESWPMPEGKPKMVYVDVDSAPEGQLGALLVRHQQRVRGLIVERSP